MRFEVLSRVDRESKKQEVFDDILKYMWLNWKYKVVPLKEILCKDSFFKLGRSSFDIFEDWIMTMINYTLDGIEFKVIVEEDDTFKPTIGQVEEELVLENCFDLTKKDLRDKIYELLRNSFGVLLKKDENYDLVIDIFINNLCAIFADYRTSDAINSICENVSSLRELTEYVPNDLRDYLNSINDRVTMEKEDKEFLKDYLINFYKGYDGSFSYIQILEKILG